MRAELSLDADLAAVLVELRTISRMLVQQSGPEPEEARTLRTPPQNTLAGELLGERMARQGEAAGSSGAIWQEGIWAAAALVLLLAGIFPVATYLLWT